MCRSSADGGRRCTGKAASGPPDDGRTRVEVHTNKRSYTVVGGEKVMWLPGEKVVSMDVVPPASSTASDRTSESYEGTPWQGYDEYMQRSAELERRIAAGESITDIMREEHMERMKDRIAQIAQEGW